MILEIDPICYEDEVLMNLLINSLSERDKKIITMARDGYSTEEIVNDLEISIRQVQRIIKDFKERWENGE